MKPNLEKKLEQGNFGGCGRHGMTFLQKMFMGEFVTNKRKIINDPVYGFLTIRSELIFDLIEHPYFQRLRRIKQQGLSYLVYPGANHTRFEHALGSLHLMRSAIEVLQSKGVDITAAEADAAAVAILLHDVGHGPFSHALESSIVPGEITHEQLSLLIMERLNEEFGHKLDLAIQIFTNNYSKDFLHQLVSSQIDVDRLDYLRRDSFYSGVVEGAVGSDRIIKMLNVCNNQLVVDRKGIYSIEKFLVARRLMYWQVYLHKTVIAAEHTLIRILKRAKELTNQGQELFGPDSLQWFLHKKELNGIYPDIDCKDELLQHFTMLDDSDILSSIKMWSKHPDHILSMLSTNIMDRRLPKIKISDNEFSPELVEKIKEKAMSQFSLSYDQIDYLVFSGDIANNALANSSDEVLILSNDGTTSDIQKASDIDLRNLSKTVRKHYLCYPKELDIN